MTSRSPGATPARRMAVLLLVPAFAMCGGSPEVTPPAAPPAAPIEVVRAPEPDTTLAGEVEKAQWFLGEADGYLRESALEQAAAGFQRVLDLPRAGDPAFPRELRARALWGTALTGLLSLEPGGDTAPTLTILETLILSSDGTVEAAQARLAVAMIKEIDKLRALTVQKDEDIRRLNETMEQLKRIDLSRRPSGVERDSPLQR